LVVGALIGAVFFLFPGCQGPTGQAGPAGKDGLTLHDTIHIYDSTVKYDTVFKRDSTIIRTRDTMIINDSVLVKDSIIKRDTTVKYDTLVMNPTCLACHSTGKWDSITAEYQMSYHFTRGVVNNTSRYCERCHTSEGFQEIIGDGLAAAQAAIPMATRISCATCHEKKGLDFVDTAACILRTISPVVLSYNNSFNGSTGAWTTTKSTDFGEIDNLCANCHQIRGATSFSFTDTTSIFGTDTSKHNPHKFARPDSTASFAQLPLFPVSKFAPTDTVSYLASRSFAVHDGNQTNLTKGVNGYEYPGVSYATAGKDSTTWHHINAQCTDCHLATQYSAADSTGGHTFRINRKDAKCNTCHNLATQMSTDSSAISGLLVQLGDLLVARKVMTKKTVTAGSAPASAYSAQTTSDFYGNLYRDTAGTGLDSTYYASTASLNSVAPTTGLLNYDNIVTWAKDKAPTGLATPWKGRIGRPWKGGELGAAYNFSFVYTSIYQHSFGIHNPAYAKALLQTSIDWLNANP
jgi:hypothetical protein